MLLCEELYFEITLTGAKSEIKKLISFLKTGGLDDFFEFSADYISYDDEFDTTENEGKTSVVLANDDYGIEIDELDTDDFLDVFCRAAKNLEVVGSLYDADEDEYRFVSDAGESYYLNSDRISRFNEDLDREEEDDD
ncbi:MAG: hypothetical protein IKC34_02740 [Clostridia bacterium]|nr:hypothetical protein [Clostridia bacterium]